MKKTEQELIDITFDLLYKHGYCDTNIRDILKRANVTKGALYYHFTSKHDLVLKSMTFYLEQILEYHWVQVLKSSPTPIKTLVQQIKAYETMFLDPENFLDIKHGCPLNNFILDMSDKDEVFFEYLKEVYLKWQKAIEMALVKAQDKQETKTKFNAKAQAIFIISSFEGSIGSAKALHDEKVLKSSISILITHINSL